MPNIESIKSAIVDREEELNEKLEKERIIERELKINTIDTDVANIITGVRRSGKSTLAFMLTKDKNACYVNFEDERLQIDAKDLNIVLKAIYELKGDVEFIVFDEIQVIDGWELFISRIISSKKIIITGSNARLLSKELSTHLTGRHIDYELFPFSFREYLNFINLKYNIYSTKQATTIKNRLHEYLKIGGLPLTYKFGQRFLISNYSDILERDILQRYNIAYKKTLKEIAMFLLSNIGNIISYKRLSDIFKISVDTAKNYLEYFEKAYLFFLLNKFDYKIKEQQRSLKKVYCIDTGLYNALGFKFSENIGRLMENLVYIELLRQKSYFNPNMEIYYYKDYQGYEIDFLVKQGPEIKELIQVTYASEFDEIAPKEYRALVRVSELFKGARLTIVTWDYEDQKRLSWFGKEALINFVPLWKWLLRLL